MRIEAIATHHPRARRITVVKLSVENISLTRYTDRRALSSFRDGPQNSTTNVCRSSRDIKTSFDKDTHESSLAFSVYHFC